MTSPEQLVLLYRCSTCGGLVPYEQAMQIAPWSSGANSPLHQSCTKLAIRWFARPHLTGKWNLSNDSWEWQDKAAP